jgi:hypothetical protein
MGCNANHLVAEGVLLAEHCALEEAVVLRGGWLRLRRRAVEIQIHDSGHDPCSPSTTNQPREKLLIQIKHRPTETKESNTQTSN